MKIVERVMNNCYFGDGTVHSGDHLLFIHELCELFKCAGISMDKVKRNLFSLALKGRVAEWYKTLKNGRFIWLGGNCPVHELPSNIVINNFYARLSEYYKDYLDAFLEGSFISMEVEAKWDLLEAIQSNTED
jgi:hypothetical protein